MYKKCKVVMIATNRESRLFLKTGNQLEYNEYRPIHGINHLGWKYQHLYILSDDEIKEGNWYEFESMLNQATTKYSLEVSKYIKAKKIIATTDSSLGYNDILSIHQRRGLTNHYPTFKPLPSISQSFIKQYVSEYNKGNKIEEVMVEYEIEWSRNTDRNIPTNEDLVSIWKPSSDNTISIKATKTSWTREEVVALLTSLKDHINSINNYECNCSDFNWFINNNL
jgi:hypothetical protein